MTLPQTYRAERKQIIEEGFVSFLLLAVFILHFVSRGDPHRDVLEFPMQVLLLICCGLRYVVALSLRISVTEQGLTENTLFGKRFVSWQDIPTLAKSRSGYFLPVKRSGSLICLSRLPEEAQQAIAKEAIERGPLRASTPMDSFYIERWVH